MNPEQSNSILIKSATNLTGLRSFYVLSLFVCFFVTISAALLYVLAPKNLVGFIINNSR